MDPVNVVLVELICEDFWYSWDHWHRRRGRRRCGGRRTYREANGTDGAQAATWLGSLRACGSAARVCCESAQEA